MAATFHHPGMTDKFFDEAVGRAHDAGLKVQALAEPGKFTVASASEAGVFYLVDLTIQQCSCKGQRYYGRCYHRAMVIFLATLANTKELAA